MAKRIARLALPHFLGSVALLWAVSAYGFSSGIATTSFPVPSIACNFCHGGGTAPTVTLECVDCGGGPPSVDPLSMHEFKLTVFEVGLQTHAGLNVSSVLGTLAIGGAFASGTQSITGTGGREEITHTAPKAASAGMTEFSFLWTAPAAPTTATLQGWGNAVNANSNTSGDAATSATLNVLVTGDTPTPTSTPTATDTPAATPTPTATLTASCPSTADAGCISGFYSGLLLVKTDVAGKERLVAKLRQGPALAQTDMGNPLDATQGGTGTIYTLCVYDDADALAGSLSVNRAGATCGTQPCWKPLGHAPNDPNGPGKGYRYKDADASADGVRKILYKGGTAGTSKALVIAKGPGIPAGIPAALQASASTTVQLRSSDGECLAVTLSEIQHSDPAFFKAK